MLLGLAALALAAAVGASQLAYSKKERVTGVLSPEGGEVRVLAPAAGVVELKVGPGEHVATSQTVAVIRTAKDSSSGQDSWYRARQQALARRQDLLNQELEAHHLQGRDLERQALARVDAARVSVEKSRAEAAARAEQLELAQRRMLRQQELKAQGFVSAATVDQLHAEVLAHKAELTSAERTLAQAQSEQALHKGSWQALQAQRLVRENELQRSLILLGQEEQETQTQAEVAATVRTAGRVTALAVSQGSSVRQGDLLLKMARPDARLEATLYLPASTNGRVTRGQRVLLELTAFPYQTYGFVTAEVSTIEETPLLPEEATSLRLSGAPAGVPFVRASVRLLEVPPAISSPLKPGMALTAAIEVERKSFLAWMAAPLLNRFR